MGLMDILNGMQNGPRGQPQPSAPGSSGSGMSPMTMALIGLLAFKALKSLGGGSSQPAPTGANPSRNIGSGQPSSLPGGTQSAGGGGLSDILGGLLGGGRTPSGSSLNELIPGGVGNVLSGGLGNLIRDLQSSGQGRAAQSWVGKGENQEIEPNDLAKALGSDTINALTKQTGMSRDDLLEGLSQHLPDLVDRLTPEGRLPTQQEAARW